MDAELLQSIRDHAALTPGIHVLEADETEQLRIRVAERFDFPWNRIWWWECLPATAVAVPYAGGQGLDQLLELLPKTDVPLYLFATDDDPPPWVCVFGPATVLVDMLREQRFFECFLVDSDMKWIVFDTHHNTLVAFGEGLRSFPMPSTAVP